MAEKPKIKRKIVVKTTGKSGTIADKISTRQELEKKEQQKVHPRQSSVSSSADQSNVPNAESLKQTAPQSPVKETTSLGTRKAPRTVFVVEQPPVKPSTVPARTEKDKKGKTKSSFREDVIRRKEQGRYFFEKEKTKKKSSHRGAQTAATSSIPAKIKITEFIQVGELARKLNVRTPDVIAKLMKMGVMATITQSIDAETATLLAAEFGSQAEVVSLYDETLITADPENPERLQFRAPVVTIMGHVDHGKTKLLDALRHSDNETLEAGGITQHIGAYQVAREKGKITFLDTPGHEAFTAMRARGAQVTDIVVLVVAADDGVMPQTIEAIQHAKDAQVPVIVAINKIDKPAANAERIRQELAKYDLLSEEWGGNTVYVEVSALQKLNLDSLEDAILAQAELMELKADPDCLCRGTVVEAKLDQGRGPVATILVQSGTLRVGDAFVVGLEGGKVRAMLNDHGVQLKEAPPSTPVEILGLSGVPNAGETFYTMKSEREAKGIVEKRQELHRQQQAQKVKKASLDNLDQFIEQGKVKELKLIIKADVHGSVEALQTSLEKLSSDEIRIRVILSSTGEIAESDVMLASAAKAMIIGFNTRANARVREIANKEGVEIRYYSIIYQAIDEVKAAIGGMLSPEISEEITGEAQVRQIFKVSNIGTIAGCMVTSGFIKRNSAVRLIRDGVVIYTGTLKSLKRFQDDASEVKEGYECGISIENYNDLRENDVIEAFAKKETARKFEDIERP